MSADMLAVAEGYKTAAIEQGFVVLASGHRCTRSCVFADVPLERYRTGHICSPYAARCTNFIHSLGDNVYTEPIPRDELAVAVCKVSANPHFCGRSWCTETVETNDGHRVCQWTGVVMSTSMPNYKARYDVTKMEGYVARNPDTINLGNEADRSAQAVMTTESISRRGHGTEGFRIMCLKAATSVLSPDRFRKELDTMAEETRRIKENLRRYLAKCNTDRILPNAIEMFSICLAERKRAGETIVLRASPRDVPALAAHWANVAQILWGLLRTRCYASGGDRIARRQNFKDFILAVFEFMQTGLVVTSPHGDRVTVIDCDPLLAVMPMTPAAQSMVLSRPKNLSNMRKNIERALQNTVNGTHVNPQELRISSLSIHHFDQTVFI